MNINFVLIHINYVSIDGNAHAPERNQTYPYLVILMYQEKSSRRHYRFFSDSYQCNEIQIPVAT